MQDDISQQPKVTNEEIIPKSNKKILIILISLLLGATLVLVGFIVVRFSVEFNSQSSNNSSIITSSSSSSSSVVTYTSPQGMYSFEYPGGWEVVDEIPSKFKAKGFIEDGVDVWLTSKLFSDNCNGPVLINKADTDALIVISRVSVHSEVDSCAATGWFMDDGKWQVTDKYYDQNTQQLIKVNWKGDYSKSLFMGQNSTDVVFGYLFDYQTQELRGEDVLQQINSTFSFHDLEPTLNKQITYSGDFIDHGFSISYPGNFTKQQDDSNFTWDWKLSNESLEVDVDFSAEGQKSFEESVDDWVTLWGGEDVDYSYSKLSDTSANNFAYMRFWVVGNKEPNYLLAIVKVGESYGGNGYLAIKVPSGEDGLLLAMINSIKSL